MAIQDSFNDVQELSIAYYRRPADPGSLHAWAQRLEAAGGSCILDAFAARVNLPVSSGKAELAGNLQFTWLLAAVDCGNARCTLPHPRSTPKA
jgi:hypothetical protein